MGEKTQYISLSKASKYCSYSQEYLSLRARQGKLKAIKIGRNWVTKKEWLDEYLKNFSSNNKNEVLKKDELKKVEPPANLPVETEAIKLSLSLVEPSVSRTWLKFAVVLIFILFIGGSFLFWHVQRDESLRSLKPGESRASTIETFKEYAYWLKSQAPKVKTAYFTADDYVKEKFIQGYRIVVDPFSKVYRLVFSPPEKIETQEEPEILETTEEGMVVVPSTEDDEEMKTKIKEAFSDEVRVEIEDETSGIIIPVFREREGDKYLYIMVPVKN